MWVAKSCTLSPEWVSYLWDGGIGAGWVTDGTQGKREIQGLQGGGLGSFSVLPYGARCKHLGEPWSHGPYEAGKHTLVFSKTGSGYTSELLAVCILQSSSPTPALNSIFIDANPSSQQQCFHWFNIAKVWSHVQKNKWEGFFHSSTGAKP